MECHDPELQGDVLALPKLQIYSRKKQYVLTAAAFATLLQFLPMRGWEEGCLKIGDNRIHVVCLCRLYLLVG